VRQGSVFRRCTCGARFGDGRRCRECGSDSYAWSFVVDLAVPGAPRKQRRKGGFNTKAAAIAAMNELQVAAVSGTNVEPSKLTVGAYLKLWVAGGCGGVRPWTLRGYSAVVRVHLVPRLGTTRLQALSRSEIKAHCTASSGRVGSPGTPPLTVSRTCDRWRRGTRRCGEHRCHALPCAY